MNCPRCGNPLPPNAMSCNRCGLTRPMPPGASGNPADYIAQGQRMYSERMAQLTPAQRAYIEANMAAAGVQHPFGQGANPPRPPPPPPARAMGTCPKCQGAVPAGAKFCPSCAAPMG